MNDDVIKAIRTTAAATLPPGAKIWLFGSRARGDHRGDSDWDLLVLIDQDRLSASEMGEYSYPFRELGWQLSQDINPIVHTVKGWQQRSFLPLHSNIARDGILLWH